MKILVTGATGMVARNIVETIENDYTVLSPTSRELNLLDKQNVYTYLVQYNPDMIIHCAGIVGGIQANMAHPVKFLVDNIQMGINILTTASQLEIGSVMNMASSCMYPRNALNPLSESLILQGELEPTNEGYALAKITTTRLCEYISKENPSLHYKTLIPCNLYGKYDKFDPRHSHMIPAVIKKVHDAKQSNTQDVEIWGDGLARREFMYAGDLADFVSYAIEHFDTMPQNLNVGLGHDYTINDYYTAVARVIGFNGKFKHDLSKPVGMKQKLIDDSLLKSFGWSAKTSLEDGIEKTYKYYLEEVIKHG